MTNVQQMLFRTDRGALKDELLVMTKLSGDYGPRFVSMFYVRFALTTLQMLKSTGVVTWMISKSFFHHSTVSTVQSTSFRPSLVCHNLK